MALPLHSLVVSLIFHATVTAASSINVKYVDRLDRAFQGSLTSFTQKKTSGFAVIPFTTCDPNNQIGDNNDVQCYTYADPSQSPSIDKGEIVGITISVGQFVVARSGPFVD